MVPDGIVMSPYVSKMFECSLDLCRESCWAAIATRDERGMYKMKNKIIGNGETVSMMMPSKNASKQNMR